MIRRRIFASMAVWAAAMGCAIALLTSCFGHLRSSQVEKIKYSRMDMRTKRERKISESLGGGGARSNSSGER